MESPWRFASGTWTGIASRFNSPSNRECLTNRIDEQLNALAIQHLLDVARPSQLYVALPSSSSLLLFPHARRTPRELEMQTIAEFYSYIGTLLASMGIDVHTRSQVVNIFASNNISSLLAIADFFSTPLARRTGNEGPNSQMAAGLVPTVRKFVRLVRLDLDNIPSFGPLSYLSVHFTVHEAERGLVVTIVHYS